MTITSAHPEMNHYLHRSGWLRAAVLGANDGIVSISSLIVGVAAAGASQSSIMVAGIAGLVAGAMSMAAGEYVSVSSQSDIEKADIEREKWSLRHNKEAEFKELVSIYRARGLSAQTAKIVAKELSDHDLLGAHIRDELGLSEIHAANPFQAALASAATFTIAGAVPLIAALLSPDSMLIYTVLAATIIALFVLGYAGAKGGGAPVWPSLRRVVMWGIFAMGITALVGRFFDVVA